MGLATLLHLAGDPAWGVRVPYITFYPAVVLSAWLGGLGPGVAATLLAAAAANYLWLQPRGSFAIADFGDLVGLLTFVGMGVLVSVFGEAWRRAERERAALVDGERAARAEAERANCLKDEFLAVLSHELRTPLSATLGWASLLSSGVLPPERARHAAEVIERNARAEARLVDSLLDLSRLVGGKLRLELAPLDLGAVVQTAADMLRPEADAKGVALEVVTADGPVTLNGDAGRLQQVFWNLLSNAVKFTPQGGRVVMEPRLTNGRAKVRISDTGQGIDPDFLPHVFDRFTQGDSMRHARGSLGLGLAIVRELVQAHGGTVVAESPGNGHGTTFTVALPIAAVAAAADREFVPAARR